MPVAPPPPRRTLGQGGQQVDVCDAVGLEERGAGSSRGLEKQQTALGNWGDACWYMYTRVY